MDTENNESPEIHPCVYDLLIFNKGGKTMNWGEDVILTYNSGTTGYPHAKQIHLDF